jgi:hypothetical protein
MGSRPVLHFDADLPKTRYTDPEYVPLGLA